MHALVEGLIRPILVKSTNIYNTKPLLAPWLLMECRLGLDWYQCISFHKLYRDTVMCIELKDQFIQFTKIFLDLPVLQCNQIVFIHLRYQDTHSEDFFLYLAI